jgi:hypothetical protein
MSSREQYKGALKDSKQTIATLKKGIITLQNENSYLKGLVNKYEPMCIKVTTKKWWQFWK